MSGLFHSLPEDVLRTIFHEWIGRDNRRSFAAVDIAMCNKLCREKYYGCFDACEISYLSHWYADTGIESTKFQSFLGWAKLRGAILTKMKMTKNYPINLLSWKSFPELEILSLQLNEQMLNLNMVFKHLRKLKMLKICGTGDIHFTVMDMVNIPSPTNLTSLVLHLMHIDFSSVQDFVKYCGTYAKELTKVDFSINTVSYKDLLLILHYLSSATDIAYKNIRSSLTEEEINIENEYDELFSNPFRSASFPSVRKLLFHAGQEALLPLLTRFPNLEDLEIKDSLLIDLPLEFVEILCEQIPSLKSYKSSLGFGERGNIEFLRRLPPTKLETLTLDEFENESLNVIPERFSSLKQLTLQYGGFTSNNSLGILPWCTGSMVHVEELCLSEVQLTSHMLIGLLASTVSFPSLTKLRLHPATTGIKINHFMLFYYLMTSPFHNQLTYLQYSCDFKTVYDLSWEKGINWKEVPVWTKLEEIHFVQVPLFQLDKLLEKTPNLTKLDMSRLCKLYKLRRNGTQSLMFDGKSILCMKSFQAAKRLETFACSFEGKLDTDEPKEYLLWKEVFNACPKSMHTFIICDERNGRPYWKRDSVLHQKLVQEYQHKFKLVYENNDDDYDDDDDDEDDDNDDED